MHRVLQVLEIQRIIFASIGLSNWDPEYPRTLARLARTCKAFHEVALAELWSKVPSLVPLVQVLGDSVVERASKGETDSSRPDEGSALYAWKKKRTIVSGDCFQWLGCIR